MDAESLIRTALREAGYGQDAIGSALPRIMRILEAEDVRLEVGRPLSRKERDYVRVQLEIGLGCFGDCGGVEAVSRLWEDAQSQFRQWCSGMIKSPAPSSQNG